MSDRSYFGKDDISPDFLKNQKAESSAVRAAAAKSSLRSLENQSASTSSKTTSAREAENKSFYTGSGKNHKSRKKNSKSSLKKSGPLMVVLGLIFAFIFFMFGSASMLGSQIESLITRATDTMFGSYSENAVRVTKEVMEGKRGEFPDYLKERFEDREIQVQSNGVGYDLIYDGRTITASTFDNYYETDIGFREAFTKAKRGRTSNFFDVGASLVYAKLMLSRNLFSKFQATGDEATDSANYKATESDVFDGGTNTSLNTVGLEEVTDEDGNTSYVKKAAGSDVNSSATSGDTPKIKAKNYLMDIAGRVTDAGGIACAALKVGNIISTAVAVNEIYQAINYFVSNQENVSKTLGGEGDKAAMNSYLNHISETKTTTYIDSETGEEKEVTGSALEAEGFANALAGEKANTNKTKDYSIESAFVTTGLAIGLTAANNKLCGGIRVAGAVVSLISFAVGGGLVKSLVTLAKSFIINAALQTTITSMLSALIPRIAETMFTNTFDNLEGIPAGENLAKGADLLNSKDGREGSGQLLATKSVASAYNKYTVAAAEKEAEIDRATHSPFDASNPNTFLGSFVGKFATIVGASNLIGAVSTATNIVSRTVGALTGHLINSVSAVDLSDQPMTFDTTLSGVDFQTIYAEEDTCKNLTEIGAVCDMYGAEITATHPDVINVSSDDPTYQSVLSRNVRKNDEGHYEVIEGSLLSQKVKYCDNRDSPFGVIDANIINDFEVSLGILDYVPVLSDVVEIVSAAESASDEAMGWGTGAYCVMDEENNPYFEDLIYLQHFEEDQRIASQMKLDEVTDENGNDVNPITAYMMDYYEKNPIDTSETGLIAHFTGSTKEDAELAVALIEYIAYLNDYTPPSQILSETIATNLDIYSPEDPNPSSVKLVKSDLSESIETPSSKFIYFVNPIKSEVVYDSIRSKSYAV